MPNLYLVQNIMIFMEEYLVKEPSKGDCYTLNPYYVKNPTTFSALKDDISRLCPHLTYVSYSICTNVPWGSVYMSSYFPRQHQSEIEEMNCSEIVLVEDGLFDYIEPEDGYPFYGGKRLYIFRPEIASNAANGAFLQPIPIREQVVRLFKNTYSDSLMALNQYDRNTAILFTTPFEEDFSAKEDLVDQILKYLENKHKIRQLILAI